MAIKKTDGSEILLAAHRGDLKYYPENTLPAFKAALDAGIEPVSLGRRILRSETAAHFILACLAYETEL